MIISTRMLTLLLVHALLVFIIICLWRIYFRGSDFIQTPIDPTSRQGVSDSTHINSSTPKHRFEHVLIIVLENQDYEDVIRDPYFSSLAKQGAIFTNFHALFHPSYPNYLAMVAGKEIRTKGDEQINVDEKTIAYLLESKGLTWKNYAEEYPGRCFKGSHYGRYARNHVPFISFVPIQKHGCDNIVPASQFIEDLHNNSLPNYMFYSPNLDNDGHDTGLVYASNWLKSFLEPLRQNRTFMKDTLIIVTFDESGSKRQNDTNHIYTVFLGDMVKPGPSGAAYNHYNVLRTIEENFGLSPLADGDGGAKPITDVWK